MYPENLKYKDTHEWVEQQGNTIKIGISKYAIDTLGDLTYLEFSVTKDEILPKGEAIGEVESVKTTSEIYTPVSGKIIAVNENLAENLEDLMENPYQNWMLELELADSTELDSLLSSEEYQKILE